MAEADDEIGARTVGSITVAISVGLIVLICNTIFIPIVWNEVSSTWEQFDQELQTVKNIRTAIKETLEQIPVRSARQTRESVRELLNDETSSPSKRRRTIVRRRWIHRRKGGKGAAAFGTRNIDKTEIIEIYSGSKMQCKCMSTNTCPRGLPGPAGPKGEDGTPGEPGNVGEKGIDAMDIIVQMVPSGCFVCPAGPNGSKGEDGPAGLPGPVGPPGMHGIPGSNGAQGSPGDIGLPGKRGTRGKPGAVGNPGPDAVVTMGTQGPKGPPGPIGPPGERGDAGRDNHEEGQPGIPGIRGEPGLRGIEGNAGERGTQGLPGKPGHKRCRCKHLLRLKEATKADSAQRDAPHLELHDKLQENHLEKFLPQLETIKAQEKMAPHKHGVENVALDRSLKSIPSSILSNDSEKDSGNKSKTSETDEVRTGVPEEASTAASSETTSVSTLAASSSLPDRSQETANSQALEAGSTHHMDEKDLARSEVSSQHVQRPASPYTAPRTNIHAQLLQQSPGRNSDINIASRRVRKLFALRGNSLGYRKLPKARSRHRHSDKSFIVHPVSTNARTRQRLALARQRRRERAKAKKAKNEQRFKTTTPSESKTANKLIPQNQATPEGSMSTELPNANKFKDLNVVPTNAHHRSASRQMHAAAAYRSTQAKELVPLPFDESMGDGKNDLEIPSQPALDGAGSNGNSESSNDRVKAEESVEHFQTPKKGRSRTKLSSLASRTKRKHRKHAKKANKKLKKVDIPIVQLAALERTVEEEKFMKTQDSPTRAKTPEATNARELSKSSQMPRIEAHLMKAFEAAEVNGDTSNGEFGVNRYTVFVDRVTHAPVAARVGTSGKASTPQLHSTEGASSRYNQLLNSESLESNFDSLAEDARVMGVSAGGLLERSPQNEHGLKIPVIDEDAGKRSKITLESSPSSIRQLQRQRRLLQDMRRMEELERWQQSLETSRS